MQTASALFVLFLLGFVNCRPQHAETSHPAEGTGHDEILARLKRQIIEESSDPSSTTKLPPPNPEITTVYKVSCPCPFTPQYSPVCGSDGQTYGNSQILNCAKLCGVDVTMVYQTACGKNRG